MSTEQIWSWIVTIVGVTGFFLAGKKIWWAWYVNLFCQVLWVIFAFVTGFYAFLAGVAVYTVVFAKNAYHWTKEHFEDKPETYFGHNFDSPIGELREVKHTRDGLLVKGRLYEFKENVNDREGDSQ